MDMAFLSALNRADTFPPPDPWLAGADLNYYYLGHLAMAVLVKLTAVEATRGYNLALATVVALTASATFTLAGTLWGVARGPRGAVAAGLGAVGLVVVAGNLEGARLLVAETASLIDYPWFEASRVVPDTINEFPWFSFLVGRPPRPLPRAAGDAAGAGPRGPGRAGRAGDGAAAPRGGRGAGHGADDRPPVRGQRLVGARAGRPAGAGGGGLGAGPAQRAAPHRVGPLAAQRAGPGAAAAAPVPPRLRARGERPRRGARPAAARRVAGRPGAALRHSAPARRRAVRRAAPGEPAAAAHGGVGRSSPWPSPARSSRRSGGCTPRCSRWPSRSRSRRSCPGGSSPRSAPSGSWRPAGWPACWAPSCCTCATSSTAASSTA